MSTFTTNYNLEKPEDGDTNWGEAYRDAMDTIDMQIKATDTTTVDHINDATDAHDASAISTVPGDVFVQTSVQAYLDDIDNQFNAIVSGGVVTITGSQTITGPKTFTQPIVGNLTGNVTGNLTGGVTGNVTGDLTGNVTGNVTGDLTGNVTGNVTGALTGNVTGDLTGNVTGDLTGNVTGDLTGNVTGDLTGNVTGNVTGNLTGNVTGNVSGTAANVTGVVAIVNGGTGAATAPSAKQNLGTQDTFNGIEDLTKFSMAYDAAARTLTVTYGAGAAVWVNGVRYTKTGSDVTSAHTGATGKYFFYYNAAGALVASASAWDLLVTAPLALVYYKHNATPANAKAILFDERHPAMTGFSDSTHRYAHSNFGTQLSSGATIADYTLDTGGAAALSYSVGSATLDDEDLRHTAVALSDGGPYVVFWGDSAAAATWDWDLTSTTGVLDDGTNIYYNDVTTGVRTAVAANNNWVNYWPIALPFYATIQGAVQTLKSPGYAAIMGQNVYGTLAAATAVTPTALVGLSNLTEEGVVFARITYARRSGNSPSNAQIDVDPTYFRGNIITSSSGSLVPTDHQSLSNRSASAAHPATAVAVDGANLDKQLTGVTTVQGGLETLDEGTTYIKSEASDPSGAEGKVYFNSTTKKFLGYNGTAWGEIGGGKFQANTVTTTTFTLTDNGLQKWVHDGLAADVITQIVLSSVTDGSMIIVIGSSNSNPLTIPATATGIAKQNGDMELGLGNTITYLFDTTVGLIETSRS